MVRKSQVYRTVAAFVRVTLEISFGLALLLCLNAVSDGGLSLGEFIWVPMFVAAATLSCLIMAIVDLCRIWRRRSKLTPIDGSVLRRTTLRTVAVLGVGALVVFGYMTGALHTARFALSRDSFERAITSLRVAEPPPSEIPGRWLGLLYAREIDVQGTAVRFILAECGTDDCGMAYSPSGPPPRVYEDAYWPYDEGWWFYRRSW